MTHTYKDIENVRNEISLNITNENNDLKYESVKIIIFCIKYINVFIYSHRKNSKFIERQISIMESQAIKLETQKEEINKKIDYIYKSYDLSSLKL